MLPPAGRRLRPSNSIFTLFPPLRSFPCPQVLTRELDQLVVHDDVLGVIQVAGQRHHVRACELVCAVNGFIFTICPEDSILKTNTMFPLIARIYSAGTCSMEVIMKLGHKTTTTTFYHNGQLRKTVKQSPIAHTHQHQLV